MVFEIELKALLTKRQYESLVRKLSQELELINEDTIHTIRYRPGDVRFRLSPKICELVQKEGEPTQICRGENIYPIEDKEKFQSMQDALKNDGYKADPPWIKYKKEFLYPFDGFEYIICLQDIKNFAYLMEVEHMAEKPDIEIHEPNLRAIMSELGCEPIEPTEFLEKIDEYIKANKEN